MGVCECEHNDYRTLDPAALERHYDVYPTHRLPPWLNVPASNATPPPTRLAAQPAHHNNATTGTNEPAPAS